MDLIFSRLQSPTFLSQIFFASIFCHLAFHNLSTSRAEGLIFAQKSATLFNVEIVSVNFDNFLENCSSINFLTAEDGVQFFFAGLHARGDIVNSCIHDTYTVHCYAHFHVHTSRGAQSSSSM